MRWETFTFSPCVCTVVNRLYEFSYDGIPKDGAFLTPVQCIDSSPGSKDIPSPGSPWLSLGFRPEISSGREKRKFPSQFCAGDGSQPGAGPVLESCSTLAGKCWLPGSVSRVPVTRPRPRRRMSPCPDPSQTWSAGTGGPGPASQVQSDLDKEISHSKAHEN